MSDVKYTVAMATYDDFSGVFFSVQALRMYQDMENVEILILDNNPKSEDGRATKQFAENSTQGDIRYATFEDNNGTSSTRHKLFDLARGEVVIVMDCHVLLAANAINRFKKFWESADSEMQKNLFTGPLIMDNLKWQQTHFELEWRDEMWGTWATAWKSPEGLLMVGKNINNQLHMREMNTNGQWMNSGIPFARHEDALMKYGFKLAAWNSDDAPIEIPAQGLGMFISSKEHWLGFNPHHRHFGGEEGYIHEKYRKAGRKTLCLPYMKWNHRFGRPGGPKYPITREGKIRNYVLEFQELGRPLDEIYEHFVVELKTPLPVWEAIVADPINFKPHTVMRPNTMPENMQVIAKSNLGMPLPIDTSSLHVMAVEMGSNQHQRDLNQHCSRIMETASKCKSVLEFTKRRESTLFLAAGLSRKCSGSCKQSCDPKDCEARLVSFQSERDTLLGLIDAATKTTAGRKVSYKDNVLDLQNIAFPVLQDRFDMLYIDTIHDGELLNRQLEMYGKQTDKYIGLRGTGTRSSGMRSEVEGKPGLLFGIRKFLKDNPEWFVAHHEEGQYGFTWLSKIESERPPNPIRPWIPMDDKGNQCGVGSEIKKSLKMIGIQATESCPCNALAVKYDLMGPQWCRENIEEILDKLHEQAKARKMEKLFIRPAVKLMVFRAIRAAEKQIAAGNCG